MNLRLIFLVFLCFWASLNVLNSDVFYDQKYFIYPKQNSTFNNTIAIILNNSLVPIPTNTYIKCIEQPAEINGVQIPLFDSAVPSSVVRLTKEKITKAFRNAYYPSEGNVEPTDFVCRAYEIRFLLADGNYSALVLWNETPKIENTIPIIIYYIGLFLLCLISAVLLRPVQFLNKIASMFYFFLFITLLLFTFFIFDSKSYLQGELSLNVLYEKFYGMQLWVFLILLLIMFWIFVLWHLQDLIEWFKNLMKKI